MSHAIDLPMDEICNRYRNGESARVIAARYGVSHKTILGRLALAGIEKRPAHCRVAKPLRAGAHTLDWVNSILDPSFDDPPA